MPASTSAIFLSKPLNTSTLITSGPALTKTLRFLQKCTVNVNATLSHVMEKYEPARNNATKTSTSTKTTTSKE
jgi:hypothetical protein